MSTVPTSNSTLAQNMQVYSSRDASGDPHELSLRDNALKQDVQALTAQSLDLLVKSPEFAKVLATCTINSSPGSSTVHDWVFAGGRHSTNADVTMWYDGLRVQRKDPTSQRVESVFITYNQMQGQCATEAQRIQRFCQAKLETINQMLQQPGAQVSQQEPRGSAAAASSGHPTVWREPINLVASTLNPPKDGIELAVAPLSAIGVGGSSASTVGGSFSPSLHHLERKENGGSIGANFEQLPPAPDAAIRASAYVGSSTVSEGEKDSVGFDDNASSNRPSFSGFFSTWFRLPSFSMNRVLSGSEDGQDAERYEQARQDSLKKNPPSVVAVGGADIVAGSDHADDRGAGTAQSLSSS